MSPDFDPRTLPWPDRGDFERLLRCRIETAAVTPREAALLRHWRRDGYLVLRQAVESDLIDRMLEDYERAWRERPVCHLLAEGAGVIWLSESKPRDGYAHHHYRLMDFHNLSEAAARMMMHSSIIRFLTLLFEDAPAGMQSLFFEYSSEQNPHQDFAYVCPRILSHLAASWIACEDADEGNGVVYYYAGSHRIPKYNFGGGALSVRGDDPGAVPRFESYLKETCEGLGLERRSVRLRKGDVFLWHGALVHGGGRPMDRTRTRKSLVSHYSSACAYPADRRMHWATPEAVRMHGGLYYRWEQSGHLDGHYALRGQ